MAALLASGPDGIPDLEDYDLAMLWALRCVAAGRLDCPSLRRVFVDLCGRGADQLLCGLLVLVRLLAGRLERGLRLHLPGSSAMSADERVILRALARLREARGPGAQSRLAAEMVHLLGARNDASLTAAFLYVADLLSPEAAAFGRRAPETAH